MRQPRSVAAVAALAVLAACSLDTGPNIPAPIDPASDTYASSLNIDISKMTKTSSGLYYRDLELGEGIPAMAGDSVQVDYVLYLTNGTKVQSTVDDAKPFEFLAGQNPPRVIPGFDEGVLGMLPNGTRQLVIPPQLAFGSQGSGPIQPNANIVFVVTYLQKL